MSVDPKFPPISQKDAKRLELEGFTNTQYEDLKLPQWCIPRTDTLYTSLIMAGSGIGYAIARRGGYTSIVLGTAFITAPLFSMLQKRDLDYFHYSGYSNLNVEQLKQQYPAAARQFDRVLSEVDSEIQKNRQILRELEEEEQQ